MANGNGSALGSSSFRPASPTTPQGPGAGGFAPGAPSGGFGGFTPIQGAGFQPAPPSGTLSPFGDISGDRPGAPTSGTGFGGFTASPRLLDSGETAAINRDLGLTGGQALNPRFLQERQQLGPFGFIRDPASNTNFRQQIPFIETRLNFENLLQAQTDREAALQLLQEQRGFVGQGPDQQFALQVARRRLEQPEPFTPEEVAFQTGNIRSRAARGLEAGQRQFDESIAAQGLRGSASSFQGAQLQQAADRQASDELSRLAIENALRRDVNEAQAVDRLQGITGENELRQIALNQAISELLTATRGQFDLSALVGQERKPDQGALSRIGFF